MSLTVCFAIMRGSASFAMLFLHIYDCYLSQVVSKLESSVSHHVSVLSRPLRYCLIHIVVCLIRCLIKSRAVSLTNSGSTLLSNSVVILFEVLPLIFGLTIHLVYISLVEGSVSYYVQGLVTH